MRAALAEHESQVRGAIERCGGYVFATGDDGFAAAFASAAAAVVVTQRRRGIPAFGSIWDS
jgi:hypothetical protein